MPSISEIRTDYTKASLEISGVAQSPIEQFNTWFNDALKAEVLEPNAMTLATVNQEGQPSA
ncbi:MAG TPA: pyridoxamine 5'-phosphate oxidase family protein, partial [Cyclobacteriaceae bacterium]|nr:pyridoxamine 5'-phosphate oxidase family protein [Cyclobacteriaceae bacterium]